MSFSSEVREELASQIPKSRHCQAAQLHAILTMCGGVTISAADYVRIAIRTENAFVVRSFCEIIRKMLHLRCEVRVQKKPSGIRTYMAALVRHEDSMLLLKAAGLEDLTDEHGFPEMKDCCARSYLRGSFLTSGSVSDPKRSYHLEIVCADPEKAGQLCDLMKRFALDGRIVARKGKYIVYLKEAEQIVTLLALMEAPRSLMTLENIRILREITGDVNRRVNCETANINKTVEAAVRQIEDIRFIADTIGLISLPPNLQQLAALRLER